MIPIESAWGVGRTDKMGGPGGDSRSVICGASEEMDAPVVVE